MSPIARRKKPSHETIVNHIDRIQSALREFRVDGWLFYDHHHRDPIAYRILRLDKLAFVSRRWYYFIPAQGDPQKLVHRIERDKLDSLPGTMREYSSWQELEVQVGNMLQHATKIAMQYSPRNAIMYVSMVDAGTVELLRESGKQIVSSAELVSLFEAVLTEEQIKTHYAAQHRIDEILRDGWKFIGNEIRAKHRLDEFGVVTFLREAIHSAGLWTENGPNCSVGPNSARAHYQPERQGSRVISSGDFVLIDIYAKLANNPTAIWYDIAWTGVIGREPSERERNIFAIVRDARNATVRIVQQAFAHAEPIAGWQADDAARNVIRAAGFGEFFTHRTGHNIAVDLHGSGAHLDNLETHDDRLLAPNTCFSVEPGIYFPGDFGIRSEVNVMTRPGGAMVTGPMQDSLVRIE